MRNSIRFSYYNYTRNRTLVHSIFAAALLGLTFNAGAQDLAQPPSGPAPSVDSIPQLPFVEPSYSPSVELPLPALLHPPLTDIPPVPMPYPPDNGLSKPTSVNPGVPVVRDLTTGEVFTGTTAGTAVQGVFSQGGFYAGADGGSDDIHLTPASFGIKSLVTNVGDSPWRMNVKLVVRFGADWFVCSGAMRDIRTVQTAGHCIHRGSGGDFADEVLVYPGWDGAGTTIPFNPDLQTHGAARGLQLGSFSGWMVDGNFSSDYGVIALDRPVGALTGWFGFQTGTTCPTGTYHVGSYPAELCSSSGLHSGRDQYYWSGSFDSCSDNQLQLNTTPGCLTALWGGESGSNVYQQVGSDLYTRGIASTSNRSTVANYVETSSDWVNWLNTTFIPNRGRGAAADLAALDVNTPATVQAGTSLAFVNHLGVNGTNGTLNGNHSYSIRLSPNDQITSSDTLLSNQEYSFNYDPVSSVRVNTSNVKIPANTPPGTYWIGVLYSDATDGNTANNASSDWDARRIVVTENTNPVDQDPPQPDPMNFSVSPLALDPDQISMTAVTATDPAGGVQYYFDFVNSPSGGTGGSDSNWQSSRVYVDSGLDEMQEYCYRVRARDGNGNATAYSPVQCATTTTFKSCRGHEVTILGTESNDTLNGTAGDDVIQGLGGSDNIDGGGGNDIICGGNDADTIAGGPGNDLIYGGSGDDTIHGQLGDDIVYAGHGNDVVFGGYGDDTLLGTTGNDQLYGQSGNDAIVGGQDVDRCNGGADLGDSAAISCETVVNIP